MLFQSPLLGHFNLNPTLSSKDSRTAWENAFVSTYVNPVLSVSPRNCISFLGRLVKICPTLAWILCPLEVLAQISAKKPMTALFELMCVVFRWVKMLLPQKCCAPHFNFIRKYWTNLLRGGRIAFWIVDISSCLSIIMAFHAIFNGICRHILRTGK